MRMLERARRAMVRALGDGESDFHGMQLSRGSIGDPPKRGLQAQLNAYNVAPTLRAVQSRVSDAVASTHWELFAPVSKQRRDVLPIQRSASVTHRTSLVRQGLATGRLVKLDDHPLLDLLAGGNTVQTGHAVLKTLQTHVDLSGDGFLGIGRNRLGRPTDIWVLPPHWIAETPTPDRPRYRVSHRAWQADIPSSEIIWIKEADPLDPYSRGSGLGRVLADEIETAEYLSAFTKSFFYNGAKPDMVVFPKSLGPHDTGLKTSEVERLQESWTQKHAGFLRAFKPMFVGREIGIHELKHDLRGIQMESLRTYTADVIRQTYGIPPELLGNITNSNRATSAVAQFLFAKNTVLPRVSRLRQELQTRLLPEFDDRLALNFTSPVPEDREFMLSVARAAPFAFTVDEVRDLAERDPLPDGEGQVHAVPNTMRMVKRLSDAVHGR